MKVAPYSGELLLRTSFRAWIHPGLSPEFDGECLVSLAAGNNSSCARFGLLAALDFAEVEGPGGNGEDGKGQPRETKGHPKPKGGELSLEDRLESAPAHRQHELRESRYGCFARRTRLARNLVLCVVPC